MTLSDKRIIEVAIKTFKNGNEYFYSEKDVKEFIKELKDEVYKQHLCDGEDCDFEEQVQEIIDKLAGEEFE